MVTDARQTFSSSLGACPSLVLVLLWCCIGRCSAGDQTLMRAPLVCNSTFNEPLVPGLLRNCRTPALKDKAQELVASGKGSVWFKPARKAGGMTVQSFLREVHQRKQGTTFHAVEWQLLPTKCLATDPFHVYITILREPISRFRSLFFFDGPEKGIRQRPSSEPRPQGVPSTPGEVRGRSANETTWLKWIAHGKRLLRANRNRGSEHYLPNYYTRSLATQCSGAVWDSVDPSHTCHRKWDGSFGRKPFERRDIFREDACNSADSSEPPALELAMAVIDAADVVLVTELLHLRGSSLLLQRALGVEDVWLQRSRISRRTAGETMPRGIRAQMRLENREDALLYEHAKAAALRAMSALSGSDKPFEAVAADGHGVTGWQADKAR